MAFKYKLLKAIDVAGLNFLSPVVRLCYGEEPEKQIKEIGQFIVIPAVGFVIALMLWSIVAPKHKTKSGEVPTPAVVWDAANSIWTFNDYENDKNDAFNLTNTARDEKLVQVEARLEELAPLEKLANEQVIEEKAALKASLQEAAAPVRERYDKLNAKYKDAQAVREAALKEEAISAANGDLAAREAYVAKVREHREQKNVEKEALKEIRAEEDAIMSEKSPALKQALTAQTRIAEERQYLGKMRDQLTRANRGNKIDLEEEKLAALESDLKTASADQIYGIATKLVRGEDRVKKIEASNYAKPATLPYQIKRSLICVFCGFFLGAGIAIPIGILCGLSKTFMAAMTPFIALLKPVSPIVWLPIALIIVGGFIPDPDKHWLMQWMADLPWLGQYKINPAFIASAITVALCSLWATMTNTALGVASVDQDHINVARVLRLGFWDRLVKILIPSALPLIFAGLRISLGVGWMVLIAAELLSSSEGIGKFVWDQFNNGASDSFAKMMVVVFVVGVIGFLLDRIMIVFQRLVSFDGAPTAI